jgi:hypothetical protein
MASATAWLGRRHGSATAAAWLAGCSSRRRRISEALADVPGLAGDIEVEIVIKLDGFHRDALDSSKFGCGDYT